QNREVASAAGPSAELIVDPLRIGSGPVTFQPVAYYGEGDSPIAVRGEPLTLMLKDRNQPPEIRGIRRVAERGTIRLTAEVFDAEGDELRVQWFDRLFAQNRETPSDRAAGGSFETQGEEILFTPQTNQPFAIRSAPEQRADEMAVEIRLDAEPSSLFPEALAGLVFGYESETRFGFFGMDAGPGGWTIGFGQEKALTARAQRGAPLRPNRWYRLSVRLTDEGRIEGRVNDEVVCVLDGEAERWAAGPGGILAGKQPVRFRNGFRALPEGSHLEIGFPDGKIPAGLSVRVSDPWSSTWTTLP
ncbi:MAG: hypothetical protein U1E27_03520, partial [Kiritimatiellia bacterium]|nr:hypothetical protein [Kiritimatiellia bacterium]